MSSPLSRSILVIASIRLCGAPFTAAFFSKEPIVEIRLVCSRTLGNCIAVLLRLVLTTIYSGRLIKLVVLNFYSIKRINQLNEQDYLLNKSIIILYLPSFSIGSVLISIFAKKGRVPECT